MKRVKKALRFSKTQITIVIGLTLLNVIALLGGERPLNNIYIWVIILGVYPAISFLANFLDPIPGNKDK